MLTRSKIAYDLNISPHDVTLYYEGDQIRYVFSSNLYREKFLNNLDSNRDKINDSLSNRFGFAIENDKLCDLKLYTTIEKRGFLIYQNEDKVECLNTLRLIGQKIKMII